MCVCVRVCMHVPSPAFLWCVGVFGPCVAPPCWRKRAAPLTMKKLSLRLGEEWGRAEVKGQVSQLIASYQGERAEIALQIKKLMNVVDAELG